MAATRPWSHGYINHFHIVFKRAPFYLIVVPMDQFYVLISFTIYMLPLGKKSYADMSVIFFAFSVKLKTGCPKTDIKKTDISC